MFFSRTNRPRAVGSPFGSHEVIIYEERILDGLKQLVEVGKKDINEFIQAGARECDVYAILERFNRGDQDALFRKKPVCMDVVGLPTSLAAAQQQLIDVSNQFNALPLEVRQHFDNNVHRYVAEIASGNPEALRKAGFVVKQVEKEVEPVES